MKTAVLVLYVVAFILQLVGAFGVIQDVRASVGNMLRLKTDLAEADAAAEDHRQKIATVRNKPRDYGLDRLMASIADSVGEVAVERTGPAPVVQRKALLRYVTSQNDLSGPRRWVPVWLLLGGLVIGFIGNVLSLYL